MGESPGVDYLNNDAHRSTNGSLSSCAHVIVFSDSSYKTFCESRTKSINNPKCMHVNAEQERDKNNVRLCLKIWFKVRHNRYNFVDINHAR